MFARLGRLSSHHPVTVVIAWVVAAAGMASLALVGLGGGNVFDRASTGALTVDGAESTFVYETLGAARKSGTGPTLNIDIQHVDPTDPTVAAAVSELGTELADRADVAAVATPYGVTPGPAFNPARYPDAGVAGADTTGGVNSPGGAPGTITDSRLVAASGTALLMFVDYGPISGSGNGEHREVTRIATEYMAEALPEARVLAYSEPMLLNDFTHQVEADLVTGEAIALPVALLVMVLVFGGFLAASAPIIGAFASIAGGLAVLFGFSYVLDLDTSAINVVTVLGIGLSIDYGLLIVSRYREELASRGNTPDHDQRAAALMTTLTTAGRTVFFSAVTVAISVGGMLIFSADIIRGIGGAALGVVVMAMFSALTLVPAVLYLYGHRLSRPSVIARVPGVRTVLRYTADVTRDEGAFSRLAERVQRRPWLVTIATTGLLLLFALPLASLEVRNSDVNLLPVSNPNREFVDTYQEEYPELVAPAVDLLVDAPADQAQQWADSSVLSVDHVTGVTQATPVPGTDLVSIGVYTDVTDQGSTEATGVVTDIRALDAPFPVHVGGAAAIQVDFVDALIAGAPWAAGLVVLATFVLMFLMTGSVLVPLKTLLINALSLAAALGIVSWIFTDGHLEGLLNFTSAGGVETYVLVMVLAFGFGLAMDYEVFLLARVKELVDKGIDNDTAVRVGLQRSGRIITSAAAIIMLVFLGFAAGDLLVIKQVGVGLAVAVLIDATVVRMLLVPATMTLLGRHNWWAPAPLQRVYTRFAVKH